MQSAARATLLTALQQYFSIPREEAALVLDEFEPCVCRGGDWLFRQGDAADCLYLLARGRMQVWLGQASGEREERLVAEVNPGETIGEIGMLTGGARSASIRAVRNSLLLRMTSAAFDRLARQRPTSRVTSRAASPAGCATARPVSRTFAARSRRSRCCRSGRCLRSEALSQRLRAALEPFGSTCVLTPRSMREAGAPPLPTARHEGLSPAMVDWLAVKEDEHRFVLYVGDPRRRRSPTSRCTTPT